MEEISKEYNPTPSASQGVIVAGSSPTVSELSVTGLLDKDGVSVGCSPAPSNSSFLSEQEASDLGSLSRQSPFLTVSQASPSSNFGMLFTRPDFLNTSASIPDSETSSRSSLDGICPSKKSFRSRRRKNSSDSSGSEGSAVTVGGDSIEGEDHSSRKNSKTKLSEDPIVGRSADAPRGRIANIRRESNCSIDSEAAHERLVKVSHQVSTGFDEFSIERPPNTGTPDFRRRTPSVTSLGEPITIVTNSFLPQSCSPSPTRIPDGHKQCYSPSTHQIVRPNIPYSPSPSPTQSPTRNRLLRSLSPITTRTTALKRRYTVTPGVMDEAEAKRGFVRNSTSPLVTDRTFPYPSSSTPSQEFAQPHLFPSISTACSSIALRKVSSLDPELVRRTSVDSISDDQKSARDPEEMSEPSSIMEHEHRDDGMDVDDVSSSGQKTDSSAVHQSPSYVSQSGSEAGSSIDETTASASQPSSANPVAASLSLETNVDSSSSSKEQMESLDLQQRKVDMLAAMEASVPDDVDDL